jgi:putative acetyltransferase
MITVRSEQSADIEAICKINEAAFDQPVEAGLVDIIRRSCCDIVSLVAEAGSQVVGHILFSPVVIEHEGSEIIGMGLGPMAVLPERQRQGIGSQMVEAGLEILRKNACPFVIVLGHPEYYPRFGFVPASRHGLACQWEGVSDEVFMALVLDDEKMAGVEGVVRYRPEFDEAT